MTNNQSDAKFSFSELSCIRKALLTMHAEALHLEEANVRNLYFSSHEIANLLAKVRSYE